MSVDYFRVFFFLVFNAKTNQVGRDDEGEGLKRQKDDVDRGARVSEIIPWSLFNA